MNMWFVIMMLLAVALVLGPVMMMRPDPIQKNKEQMRAIAYSKGIRFTIKKLPQQLSELEPPAPIPVYFFAPSKTSGDTDWILLRTSYEHGAHFMGHWAWQKQPRATAAEETILVNYLPRLPESVLGVSSGGQGVCVYWRETGGIEALALIIELLEALNREQNRVP
jgi:hypothetical protein